jgi:hypothetical protein
MMSAETIDESSSDDDDMGVKDTLVMKVEYSASSANKMKKKLTRGQDKNVFQKKIIYSA